ASVGLHSEKRKGGSGWPTSEYSGEEICQEIEDHPAKSRVVFTGDLAGSNLRLWPDDGRQTGNWIIQPLTSESPVIRPESVSNREQRFQLPQRHLLARVDRSPSWS